MTPGRGLAMSVPSSNLTSFSLFPPHEGLKNPTPGDERGTKGTDGV